MKRYAIATSIIIVFFSFTLFPANAMAQMRKRPVRIMEREKFLDLSEEQKTQLEKLRKASLAQRQSFLEKMRELRPKIAGLMKEPEANEKKIEKLFNERAKLQADFFKSSLKHRIEMRKVFTTEQLEKLGKVKNRIRQMRFRRSPGFFKHRRFFRRHPFFSRRGFLRRWR